LQIPFGVKVLQLLGGLSSGTTEQWGILEERLVFLGFIFKVCNSDVDIRNKFITFHQNWFG